MKNMINAIALQETIDMFAKAYTTVEVKINHFNNITVTYFDGMFCHREVWSQYHAGNEMYTFDKLTLTSIESQLGFSWDFFGSTENVVRSNNVFTNIDVVTGTKDENRVPCL